ncbi:alpha/beta hydrolase [Clostridium cochlearium]|nr:alpha/beta hydrolase [Bacteroidales bacterium MSK.15.36]SNV78972.1 alpha/beta hydrolase [Clostridium cochlearium]STA92719.1 alpha/beta hydrolase [Clostridium cochlearium]
MKQMKKIAEWFVIITVVVIIIGVVFPTWTPPINGTNSISELSQIKINGTNHEFMIRGSDKSNPIIIFVHGGPACSEIPYVTKYQDILEKDFTVVHYDQRGSGKSYHFFEDYSELSSKILINDLLAVTDYISERFNKEKVLLVGHSFGTYIALQAAAKVPEKFSAYIGIGQMSDPIKNESINLKYCIEQADKAGNKNDFMELESLEDSIQTGKATTPRKYVRKYGGAGRLIDDNRDYLDGFLTHPEYNLLDVIRYSRGVSVTQDKLLKESMNYPLPQLVTSIEIPCYFIMGQYDYMTTTQSAKEYFDSIKANKKEFIVYENSAHYPQFEEKKKFSKWLVNTFLQ